MPDSSAEIIDRGTSARPMFQQSFETQAAIACLITVEVGKTTTYAQLTDAMGVDAQVAGRGASKSARRYLEREHRMVFAAVPGVGLKRLSDTEIVGSGAEGLARSRRAARRAQRRLTCVDFDALEQGAKVRQQAYLSLFNAIAALGKPTAVGKLESQVAKSARLLPLNQTLEAFKK